MLTKDLIYKMVFTFQWKGAMKIDQQFYQALNAMA